MPAGSCWQQRRSYNAERRQDRRGTGRLAVVHRSADTPSAAGRPRHVSLQDTVRRRHHRNIRQRSSSSHCRRSRFRFQFPRRSCAAGDARRRSGAAWSGRDASRPRAERTAAADSRPGTSAAGWSGSVRRRPGSRNRNTAVGRSCRSVSIRTLPHRQSDHF